MLLLFVFVALIGFLIVDFVIDKKMISPIKVFNSIWIVILSLYQLNLSYIQSSISDRTALVFLVCVALFDLTYYLTRAFSLKKEKRTKENDEKKELKETRKKISLGKKLRAINISFIVLFIVEIAYSGYLPLWSLITGHGSGYLNFGIPSLNGLMYAVAICLGAYYIFKRNPRAFIYIGFGLAVVSRQLLISMAIEAAVMFICSRYFSEGKRRIKHLGVKILIGAILIFAGFVAFGNVRSGNDVMKKVFEPRVGYEQLPDSVMWGYSYLEFSISNFNKLTVLTNGGVNHGSSSINALLPTAITKIIKLPNNFKQNYLVRPNFNVSTWFPEIYLDFGIVGVGVFSGLVAILGWFLYYNVTRKTSVKNLLLYAVFAHNILMFFFINMFLYLPVVAQFVIVPLIFRSDDEQ